MAKAQNHPDGVLVKLPDGELHFLSAEVLSSTRISDSNLKSSLEKLIAPSGTHSANSQVAQIVKVATNYDKIPATDPLTVQLKPGRPIMMW